MSGSAILPPLASAQHIQQQFYIVDVSVDASFELDLYILLHAIQSESKTDSPLCTHELIPNPTLKHANLYYVTLENNHCLVVSYQRAIHAE